MDEIATKAIIIGVSIFVTLLILTIIVFEFMQIQSVYRQVAQTDISFEERLNEFDKYRDLNNDFTGLDVRNTIKKYEFDNSVKVCIDYSVAELCDDEINLDSLVYNRKYSSSLDESYSMFKILFTPR